MNYSTCSRKSRENIKADVKQRLLLHSHFSCSICGKIPIVFHHIQEWSKKFSNDEKYMIPICDECHRNIHGSGGPIYSKKELYGYKSNPKNSRFLKKKYEIERKQDYSFFVGSNFVASGKRAILFQFSGIPLITIDTSLGSLRLSILSTIESGKPKYLVRNNELVVDTRDVWKMEFSGPRLKIWKQTDHKKIVFIDLWIKSEIIVIREMNTEFEGKRFRVYKLRQPQNRQIIRIKGLVKNCEEYYRKVSKQIDGQPRIAASFKGFDIDKQIKNLQKDRLKHELEQKLIDVLSRNLKWSWNYCWYVLDRILEESSIFRKEKKTIFDSSEKRIEILEKVECLKEKHKQEFDELQDVVIQYGGIVLSGNIAL